MRFSQTDSTSSHAGTPWYWQPEKKSHDIVILSFCNIVKGRANYNEFHCLLRFAVDPSLVTYFPYLSTIFLKGGY